MARKTEKPVAEKKVRTSYKQRKEAKASEPKTSHNCSEPKTPYNWRKHLKKEQEVDVQPQYDGPENHPEYLRAEAAVQKDLIFAELDRWIGRFPDALRGLQMEAGEITPEDIMYHLELISRILKNKYEEKQVIM